MTFTIQASQVTEQKREALRNLATLRQRTSWEGYKNLADIGCECDFVSPVTKTAGNVDSPIFVLLHDWGSDENLVAPIEPDTVRRGYTAATKTMKNLVMRLEKYFRTTLDQVYATNLFPFIKTGSMIASIRWPDKVRAAKEFAVPQIEIVKPRLVIALGPETYQAVRSAALGSAGPKGLTTAISNPFSYNASCVWCQAHPSMDASHRGSSAQVDADWQAMAAWYESGEELCRARTS